MFDWPRFLTQRRIEYRDAGTNVSKGNIVIRCPWCGGSDETGHLGISLEGKGWGCWRNRRMHSGRAPEKLIAKLLGVTWEEACQITGRNASTLGEPNALAEMMGALNGQSTKAQDPVLKGIPFLPEMQRLNGDTGLASKFYDYLIKERDYKPGQAYDLAHRYGLRYAVSGPYKFRLVIPAYMDFGLACWTGRSIYEDADIRYKALSANPDKAAEQGLPQAALSIEETLFQFDVLLDGGTDLAIGEGPLDGIRVDFFTPKRIKGTCLWGKNVSDAQLDLLERLRPLYKNMWLLLDPDAGLDVMHMIDRMGFLGVQPMAIGKQYKDPAVMSDNAIRALFSL
jgi:hypothetical protein